MTLFTTKGCSIWWGNRTTALIPPYVAASLRCTPRIQAASQFALDHHLTQLVLLNQTHETAGVHIPQGAVPPSLFEHRGDFITTDQRGLGIGVLTADCLPIIVYDPVHHAIGIAHASWRTSVQKISSIMLDQMYEYYGTQPTEVQVWFGPSAKPCCYEVQQDFLTYLHPFDCVDRVIHTQNHKIYFNLPTFNRLLLQNHGVPANAIDTQYNYCSICTDIYCSARRNKNSAERQITAVWLERDSKHPYTYTQA